MKKRIYGYLNLHGRLSCAFLCQQLLLCILIKNQITDSAAWTKIIGFTVCQTLIILTAPLLLKMPYLHIRFAWLDALPKLQQHRLLNRCLGEYRKAQNRTEKNNLRTYAHRYLMLGLALLLVAQTGILFSPDVGFWFGQLCLYPLLVGLLISVLCR